MRIIVADQEPSTRSALRMLLTAQPDMELVGEAPDIVELLSEIKANDPDLVILDWDVLGQRIERLLDLLELFDRPPTIIGLSVRAENRKAAMEAGVAGFAYKGDPPESLLAVIRQVQGSHQPIQVEDT
jgi:DNA-binding NarL/FixJ family response regulator